MSKQKTKIEMVREFHDAFELPVLQTPTIPDIKRILLRYNLIAEETKELRIAAEQGDLVEVADALADIQYVLCGTILEFGLTDKFEELFAEVHRSNMSKTCESQEQAERTVAFHQSKPDGEPCHYVEREGKWLVYRTRDMKVMKNVDYSPAMLEPIVNAV